MAKVLGKGLAALIRHNNSEQEDNNIPLKSIIPNPNQPRQNFSSEEMESLVRSISEKGIIQPLAVRKINNNQFELISGERRLRAATKLKLKTVPVHIINIKNIANIIISGILIMFIIIIFIGTVNKDKHSSKYIILFFVIFKLVSSI